MVALKQNTNNPLMSRPLYNDLGRVELCGLKFVQSRGD